MVQDLLTNWRYTMEDLIASTGAIMMIAIGISLAVALRAALP